MTLQMVVLTIMENHGRKKSVCKLVISPGQEHGRWKIQDVSGSSADVAMRASKNTCNDVALSKLYEPRENTKK